MHGRCPMKQKPHLDCPISLESVMRDSVLDLPERALLVAILIQAYRDATSPPQNDKMRVIYREARAFFAEPGLLEWFCEFLNIDPARLRQAALSANVCRTPAQAFQTRQNRISR